MENFKVLIVDDDAVDRIAVRRALKTSSLAVQFVEAWDYESALSTLELHTFDCIFMDYRLPDRNGLILVQNIRQNGIRTPLVVLTGQGDEQIAVELMKAGASDYLPKSKISAEALARILHNAVRIYRAEQEAETAKQQREQLARQREDFVYRLTHDLRTPLVAADRMLMLFEEEAFGPISLEMHAAIATMIRSNQNLLQMVNTILEVYRHDAGHKILSFSACNVLNILEEVAQALKPLAYEKQLQLVICAKDLQTKARSPIVMGDYLELNRVFTNLLGNAIKFTDQGSVSIVLSLLNNDSGTDVELAENKTAEMVAIAIQDTGSGISEHDQHHLFERFRQGENKRSGSGLGLYLSHRIIEAHHGKIQVKSQLGEGSCFSVFLPLASNPLLP